MDGVVVNNATPFSARYSKEFGISIETMLPFFKGEFQDCLIGKADLLKILPKYFHEWKWNGTADELFAYWFMAESSFSKNMLGHVEQLRGKGIKCYLATNNEKHRTKFLFKDAGLQQYFDACFSSSTIGVKKSHRDFWDEVYVRIGEPGKGTLFVWDDDQENIETAKSYGLNAQLYTDFEAYKRRTEAFVVSSEK